MIQQATMSSDRTSVIFNGTYTVENKQTKEHRTFCIETQAADASFAPGSRIVSLLSGPDNTRDYVGFGFVSDTGIKVWQKKRERADPNKPTPFEWYAMMLWDLAAQNGARFGDRYTLLIEGTCLRCNRKLTTPDSIRTGIGPVCAGRS